MNPNEIKATCSSEGDCLNLINDLIILCGASPVCLGSENKKLSPLEAATCAMKDADQRLKVQKAGCGGYICRTQQGFRGDKEYFISSLNSKENSSELKKAVENAKKAFEQSCQANNSKPEDLAACKAAASVSISCKYNFNIEGDGCLYDEEGGAPASSPVKKGGKR